MVNRTKSKHILSRDNSLSLAKSVKAALQLQRTESKFTYLGDVIGLTNRGRGDDLIMHEDN